MPVRCIGLKLVMWLVFTLFLSLTHNFLILDLCDYYLRYCNLKLVMEGQTLMGALIALLQKKHNQKNEKSLNWYSHTTYKRALRSPTKLVFSPNSYFVPLYFFEFFFFHPINLSEAKQDFKNVLTSLSMSFHLPKTFSPFTVKILRPIILTTSFLFFFFF